VGRLNIIDDYLPQDKVDTLNNLRIEYAKVHWIGWECTLSDNPLIDLVMSTKPMMKERAHGATAWYNVRPVNPKWHSDITSYNDGYPTNNLPEHTFLYYMREPDSGGELEIGGPEWSINKTFAPKENRLLYFDATLTHRVQPYEGNRVSVAWVWWPVPPDRYDPLMLTNTSYHVLERVWNEN
tara:strand:+ start:398 stop:943 length:546 start_codon:yes stop_codon:yes gene_type:complete